MGALTKYEAACQALAEAKTVDEAREISNQAEALRAYARQAKNRQLEVDAAEIRIRAERRIGEMLLAAKCDGLFTHGGLRRGKFGVSRAKLKDAGIETKLASRAQRLASVPAEKFEPQIAAWRTASLTSTSRVTPDLTVRPARGLRRRGVVQGEPFKLPSRDIRNMRVGELARHVRFLSAVLSTCGAADHSAKVGEVVSDSRIREAWHA